MIDSSAMQLKPFAFSTSSSSSSSSSFADMPSPRRVADPTGVYGQQDAAEGDVAAAAAGRKKPFPPHNAMSEREEDAFPHFSIQARRPTNRTEGKIYSILMENLPNTRSKKNK